MDNAACMDVTCDASSIKTHLRADLFHTNLEDGRSFMEQLQTGDRKFFVNGVERAEGGPCGFTVDADGFYVNQEDMVASGSGMGDLKDLFDCKFYSDRARRNEILEHNIVNMGEQLYGAATSKASGGY